MAAAWGAGAPPPAAETPVAAEGRVMAAPCEEAGGKVTPGGVTPAVPAMAWLTLAASVMLMVMATAWVSIPQAGAVTGRVTPPVVAARVTPQAALWVTPLVMVRVTPPVAARVRPLVMS